MESEGIRGSEGARVGGGEINTLTKAQVKDLQIGMNMLEVLVARVVGIVII